MFTGIFKRTLMSVAVTVAAVFSVYAQSEEFNTGKYLEIQSMILRTLSGNTVHDSQDPGVSICGFG